jgi:polyferredoxin
LITLVAAIMLGAWLNRSVLDVSVLHDRNPVYVQLSDGSLRNGFTVKILNKLHAMRSFRLSTEGLEGAELSIVGFNGGEAKIDVVPDNLRALRVLVTLPEDAREELEGTSVPFRFVVTDTADGEVIYHDATFRGPVHD